MDYEKIDAAVEIMRALKPEEREVVNYTVSRAPRKRRSKTEVAPPLLANEEAGS